ncbi:DUF1033 family protein [Lederbergia citrea]|uniref:DUF1033 family protein n=1 Tax=Lederbergia citrea TaxID=2833581 RepID=A0A942UJW0_9BACI|nr:DUF1033 family protein [Lederbergia citrea]MBS4176732.1 DUF1033 family protein [Lederbergia citrea]MBS4203293.1 DUF1033 family protein [Lederbergia citrea]MBS4222035.1 DUF1033 family protein [Lederbergia citrea]
MKDIWEIVMTKSENEPWWFFEGWEKDIIESFTFHNKEAAVQKYFSLFNQLNRQCDHSKLKNSSMAAFWNDGDSFFCDHCDDDLQVFYGLLIMLNHKPYVLLEIDDQKSDTTVEVRKERCTYGYSKSK